MDFPFRRYSDFLRERFQAPVRKITVDAGFTCPNRDGAKGMGGCIYCNNASFSPSHGQRQSIREQVEMGIERVKRKFDVDKFIVYFQAYSNTYAPLETLKGLYEDALNHPSVVGLSIGTRPDCIDEEKLAYIETLAKTHWVAIEYGLESISDASLRRIHRGHDLYDFDRAIAMTKNRGISIGTHVILGFPWECREQWIETASFLSARSIDIVKFHQLHVVKETVLADDYAEHPFPLLSLSDYLDVLVDIIPRLRPDMVIERVVGEAPKDLLVSPAWEGTPSEWMSELIKRMRGKGVRQGSMLGLRL